MASTKGTVMVGGVASGDLSADKYKLAELDDDGKWKVCNAVTDIPLGVIYSADADSEDKALDIASLNASAEVKVKAANTAIANSALVGTNASGLLVVKSAAGHYFIGRAKGDIAANEVGVVVLQFGTIHA